MLITTCGSSTKLAKSIAKKVKAKFTPLTISSFPDGDIYLKFNSSLKGKKLVLVESFQPNSTSSLFNVVFAAETAKSLGAKKVILVAPYLAYMRQDKRFNPGEAISSRVMAKLLNNSVDKIITIDPHLHRYRSLKEIFTIPATKLTANSAIGEYVKKKIRNPVIIGPDWESYQWAEVVAKIAGCESTVLEKTRYSSRHVSSKLVKDVDMKGKNVVIVDDIISTGKTIIEAAKKARKLGAKSVTAIGVHGIFVENAVKKMSKYVDTVLCTNTIERKEAKVDVSSVVVKGLRK